MEIKINQDVLDSLETGDLILFNSNCDGFFGYVDYWLKYLTSSVYTHVGMVVKETKLGPDELNSNKVYLWESGYEGKPDPTDGKIKLGVQITDLEEMMETFKGQLWVRKLNCSEEEKKKIFNREIMGKIYAQVYGKPYDFNIVDWLGAFCRKDLKPQKLDRFWCSAFIGYIYTKVRILDEKTDWSIIRPSDFSQEDKDKNLSYQSNIKLEDKQYLLFTC